MSKEEIEKQLKLSKRQSKDERYDYLCSEFNAINYCINLEKYTNKLQQENKQLKEELQQENNYFVQGGRGSGKTYIMKLEQQLNLYKEVIEEVREYTKSHFKEMVADEEAQELLQILDKAKDSDD